MERRLAFGAGKPGTVSHPRKGQSSTRARLCSQTGRGRLEDRIFGKGILAEDRPDQVFSGFAFAIRIGFRHEPAISCIEMSPRSRFRLHSALYEEHQCPAVREMFLPGHSFDFDR
jgi:hypothetical protein